MAEQTETSMNSKKIIILVIALITITAQLYIPISMAKRYEDILKNGKPFIFKVEPRDPADPFKGRYVVLTFPISSGPQSDLKQPEIFRHLNRKAPAYAILQETNDGYTKINNILGDAPKHQNYIKVKYRADYNERYFIELPFNRYYAEESKAPKIEHLVWNREDDEQVHEFYADVRIKNGYGVIAELYIDNVPILKYLEQQKNN